MLTILYFCCKLSEYLSRHSAGSVFFAETPCPVLYNTLAFCKARDRKKSPAAAPLCVVRGRSGEDKYYISLWYTRSMNLFCFLYNIITKFFDKLSKKYDNVLYQLYQFYERRSIYRGLFRSADFNEIERKCKTVCFRYQQGDTFVRIHRDRPYPAKWNLPVLLNLIL